MKRMSTVENEKAHLELEKLKEEIKGLQRSPWKKPTILIPILVPVLAVVITYYVNKDYLALKLETKALRIEQETIALETRRDALSTKVTELQTKLKLNEAALEHDRAYIDKKHRLETLNFIVSASAGVLRGYRRYIETKNIDWFQNYRREYREPVEKFYNHRTEYSYDDELLAIEKRFNELWSSVRSTVLEFERLVDGGQEYDPADFIRIFSEYDYKLREVPSLHGAYIEFETLKLMFPGNKKPEGAEKSGGGNSASPSPRSAPPG